MNEDPNGSSCSMSIDVEASSFGVFWFGIISSES